MIFVSRKFILLLLPSCLSLIMYSLIICTRTRLIPSIVLLIYIKFRLMYMVFLYYVLVEKSISVSGWCYCTSWSYCSFTSRSKWWKSECLTKKSLKCTRIWKTCTWLHYILYFWALIFLSILVFTFLGWNIIITFLAGIWALVWSNEKSTWCNGESTLVEGGSRTTYCWQ